MSARRRVRRFAAPLVVVAVSPACKKPAEDSSRPRALDASTVARTDQLMFFDSKSGGCMTYPDRDPVECDGNPTVIFPWKTIAKPEGNISFDTLSMTCNLERPGQPAERAACPPELMPTLTGGAKMTRQDGDACYWNDLQILCPGHIVWDDPTCYQADATGQRAWVECPPELLPPTPANALIYAQGTSCFPTYAGGGQGRVTCPPGGATVVLPEPSSKDLGGKQHVAFNTSSMSCQEWTDMDCPRGASCNPPPPTPVECPADLLPKLINGEKPTATKDGKCYWNDYQVACK